MTVVVSDASKYGIVMVGDTAASNVQTGEIRSDAKKIHYSERANIGFAIWGSAHMSGGTRMDSWLSHFIRDEINKNEPIDEVCEKLERELVNDLEKLGASWNSLRRGIHIAGYKNNLPVIYHLHTGPEEGEQEKIAFHKDYPDVHVPNVIAQIQKENQNLSFDLWRVYRDLLDQEYPIHLRNGYIPHFGILFDHIYRYSKEMKTAVKIQFPFPSLAERVEFFEMLVGFVADVLRVSCEPERVNKLLDSIGFDQRGLKIDKRQS
ncbi:MAG TPA: hypothetical protein VLG68_00825 [Gammaproteobacteria bacterium]|nr:hypothetical protein [Gammaproteobacteria bacterium]